MSGTEGFPFGRGYFGRGFYSRITLFNSGIVLASESNIGIAANIEYSAGLQLRSTSSLAVAGERMWMQIPFPPCGPWNAIEVPPCAPWQSIDVPPCAPWETVAASQNPFLGVWPQ